MIKLGNLARAYEELVKGNTVYKCYKSSKQTEWFSVRFVDGNLVYEDGSSGTNFFDDDYFDKFYIKENV
jgi:translation elongation factor P/translation initiation factor 5A